MSDEAKQHMGAVVEQLVGDNNQFFVRIQLTRPAVAYQGGEHLFVEIPSLDSAEALRDALSAFIAFHRRTAT